MNVKKKLPSKKDIVYFILLTSRVLFPEMDGRTREVSETGKIYRLLVKILKSYSDVVLRSPEVTAKEFIDRLPYIKKQLLYDAGFICENDPASSSIDEVVITYPGFYAIMVYRLAHLLAGERITLVPRIMTEYAHSLTGIDIHPKAMIGSPFFIDHGTGVVIGETSVIGREVKIYQGVTIGALSVNKNQSGMKRHPTIEDRVIIYANSTILGGATIIGHDSIIGGNVWLTESIPPFSIVYHQHVMKVGKLGDKENK